MTNQAGEQAVRLVQQLLEPTLRATAEALVDDPGAALSEADRHLEAMIPGLAYLDDPDNPMAMPLFMCSANLALYLAVKDRGVDLHEFGRAMLEAFESRPVVEPDFEEMLPSLRAAAEASQQGAAPGEFVFEVLSSGEDFDWGINIKSCGICAQFSKYDAVELVPYMCATDDVISDRAGDGLRRTGTIALGAHECDFRYQPGGEPKRVAEQYPDQIRIRSRNEATGGGK